ncbi:SRPBCC family protein [Ideonella livida]|uniref:ATPase n=1 Tax=Ideonella livida TaxID=2707176 RepID=A0A7C9PFF9_9BURK|nr:SRPBCC family protein [Ideonella livida]NDY90368.1 ATPase [Ideonella livida]
MPQITVQATMAAPLEAVWRAWTNPADILQWNAANDDWHTTQAEVDLRVGGRFRSRMEAKDGSMGFDFEGTYTEVQPLHRLVAEFGGRMLSVEFVPGPAGVTVRETFDAEDVFPLEQQRQGWQNILDRFAAHVLRAQAAGAGG